MGGTIRGVIDAYTNETTEFRNAANGWKVWFDFLEAHPITTRIALQWGSGGTGTDFWDGANPFGKNCFAVWRLGPSAARTYPIYLMMQCANGDGTQVTPFQAPGDPGDHAGNSTSGSYAHITTSMAIGVGGDENPWNGTTNNDGTDSKGGSAAFPVGTDGNGNVWRIPAGGTAYQAYPRSNGVGGADAATGRQMFPTMNDSSPGAAYYSLIMDDDNFVFFWSGNLDRQTLGGLMTPHPGLTIDQPWLAFYSGGDAISTTVRSEELGGAPSPANIFTEPVRQMVLDDPDWFIAGQQPNNLFDVAQFDLIPLWVRMNETPYNGLLGSFGAADGFFQFCWGVTPQSTSLTKDRIALGVTTVSGVKACVPWDGATVPSTNVTRAGITF